MVMLCYMTLQLKLVPSQPSLAWLGLSWAILIRRTRPLAIIFALGQSFGLGCIFRYISWVWRVFPIHPLGVEVYFQVHPSCFASIDTIQYISTVLILDLSAADASDWWTYGGVLGLLRGLAGAVLGEEGSEGGQETLPCHWLRIRWLSFLIKFSD